MDFKNGLLYNLSVLQNESKEDLTEAYGALFLEWAATKSPFSLSVYENKVQFKEKSFYRYSVQGTSTSGKTFSGFGRSQNQITAAIIAVMETLERFICKSVLKSESIEPNFGVIIHNGNISFTEAIKSEELGLPTEGFHSSNGWALHFNARAAAESAVREALERHILLSTYIESEWDGFSFSEAVQYENRRLIPAMANNTCGGFAAGMVLTKGSESKGSTFGYLCDKFAGFNVSPRWANAFHESFEQWEDLKKGQKSKMLSLIESTQWHYFENKITESQPQAWTPKIQLDVAQTNLLVFDLQKVLSTPFPLFASFAFGGDLLPLALKQKLSSQELMNFESKLKRLGIYNSLPEVHPIL